MADKNVNEPEVNENHCDHNCCDCGHVHDDDCGCEDELVVLQDSDGNEVKFRYIYNDEHEGKEYVYLQEADNDDGCVEIFAVQTVEENGEYYDVLDPVDDELYNTLYEKLLAAVAESDGDCDDGCDCHDDHCDCHDDGCDCHDDK